MPFPVDTVNNWHNGTTMNRVRLLQLEGEFTDLVIRCRDGKEIKVHKVIVCSQSKFFYNACKPGSPFKEAQTGLIEFTDDDSRLTRTMVDFLYQGSYSYPLTKADAREITAPKRSLNVPMARAHYHARCYVIADKYEVQNMKSYALDELRAEFRLNPLWTQPAVFPELVEFVYDNTHSSDRRLRDVVLEQCQNHMKGLLLNRTFVDTVDSVDDFWKELARRQATIPQSPAQWVKCPACKDLCPMILLQPDCLVEMPCNLCDASMSCINWADQIVPAPDEDEEDTKELVRRAMDGAEKRKREASGASDGPPMRKRPRNIFGPPDVTMDVGSLHEVFGTDSSSDWD